METVWKTATHPGVSALVIFRQILKSLFSLFKNYIFGRLRLLVENKDIQDGNEHGV
jgi:hypothetical protein